jgi:hypothetical protein
MDNHKGYSSGLFECFNTDNYSIKKKENMQFLFQQKLVLNTNQSTKLFFLYELSTSYKVIPSEMKRWYYKNGCPLLRATI